MMAPTAVPIAMPGQPRALTLPAGTHAVLLFHGLSSSPAELQFLARGLQRAGHSVHVPVIPGYSHGLEADGATGHARWLAAALAIFDKLSSQYATVAVGGLCIGAVLALRVAAQRPQAVDALLCLSTTLHYDGWSTPWHRRMLPLAAWVPFASRLRVPEGEPYGVKDERMRAFIREQMRQTGKSNAGAAALRVADLLEARRLMRDARRGLARIRAPLLLLHAREDDAASVRSAHEVLRHVRSRCAELVLLDESYHMISIDQEKHQVLAELVRFLRRVDDARSPGHTATSAHDTPVGLLRRPLP